MLEPEKWVERYGDYLFRFALLRVGDRSMAEDLVQETLVSAIQSRERFAARSSEKAWLTSILRHKIVDYLRKNARRAGVVVPLSQIFTEEGTWRSAEGITEDPGADPARVLENKEFWRVLRSCLLELSPRLAEVFALHELAGVSRSRIRRLYDLTSSNLSVMLHRARRFLRTCLARFGN